MAEIFLGDLAKAKVFDILKPLFVEERTGRLVFKGKETGEIYLERGNIVHAKTAHALGEYAFLTLMEWRAGRIGFEPDVLPPERTIPSPTDQLMLNWSYRKQEWEKIREVIPSPDAIFHLAIQRNTEEKNIGADQWNILALSNGMRTVSEMADTLGWDEYKTSKTIYQLVQAGLLERAEGKRPVEKKLVGERFFEVLEGELKKYIGPVGAFIIGDKLIEFEERRDSFPEDRALPFIESLSEEIRLELKRKEFLRVMMEFLSSRK